MSALLLVAALLLQRDTVLVEVQNVASAERITVEAVQVDSETLLLPSSALRDLLGVQMVGPWTSLAELRRAYPTVVIRWEPTMSRVLVFDELAVLPATRVFRETHRASAFGTTPIPQWSGPFGSLSVDDRQRALGEFGYLYKGRLSVQTRVDDRGASQWNASAAPTSHLFVGAQGGTGQRPSVSGRVQVGPVWLQSAYVPQQPIQVAGLVRGGPVQLFASRQFGSIVLAPSGLWTVQLAQRWQDHRTVGRISFGPIPTSPFALPLTAVR